MKYAKSNKPRQMNEREKLRKFRELDDAFAKALQEMEGASVRNKQHRQVDEQREFEKRLRSLMSDFQQNDANVDALLRTMLELGKIA